MLVLASSPMGAFRGFEGEYRYQPADDRGLKYDVFLSSKNAPTFKHLDDKARYLSVPEGMPERIHELAEQWTATSTTALDRARSIETHLHRVPLRRTPRPATTPIRSITSSSSRSAATASSTRPRWP